VTETQPATVPEEQAPRPRIVLRSAEFRKGREAAWRQLEALVDRIERRGLSGVSAEELQALPLLYRTASSSLSVARSIALDRNLIRFLENLTLRAYFVVYAKRVGLLQSLSGFLAHGFPAAVRACRWHIAIAFVAVLAGTIAGFGLIMANEDWFSALAPESLTGGRGPASTAADLRDNEIFAPWPGFTKSFIVFANFLFRHNASIAILTFGFGVVAGVPTLLLLVYQGLIFGAFIALHYNRGLAVDFMGWVSIHGVTEFGALILCGAGGLLVAQKVLFPDRHSRLESLASQGKVAGTLAGGAVLMLFVAGLIEGGLRQLINDTAWRFVFAGLTGAAWLGYFLRGRTGDGDGS
jgi:uncharacterized membrane protein SpoIIM required for sporulation